MIATILRWASLIATAIIVVSFALFAIDQSRAGSQQQIAALNSDAKGVPSQSAPKWVDIDQPDPAPAVKQARAKHHSALREKIDEADDILLKPFVGIVHSKSIWVERGIPTLIALLIFGFGGRLLANYAGTRR